MKKVPDNNPARLAEPEGVATRPISRHALNRLRGVLSRLVPATIPVAVKLAISIGIMLSIAMLLLGSVIVRNQTQLLDSQIRNFGITLSTQMASSAREHLLAKDNLMIDVLTINLSRSKGVVGTAIYTADKKVLSISGNGPFEKNAPFEGHRDALLDGAEHAVEWKWKNSPHGNLEAITFITPIRYRNVIAGYAQISVSKAPLNQAVADAKRAITAATLLLIILGIVTSYLLGRRLSRPLNSLMDASDAISRGEYDIHLHERRNDELGYLMTSINTMAQGLLQKTQVEDAFSRYVPSNVADKILGNLEQVKLGGKQVFGSVMFVDIVGFTAKSENMAPEAVAELLNEFYTNISLASVMYKGTIDKYIGDCAMLVFGIPENDVDHVFNAIACAVFFQRLMEKFNNLRIAQGKFPIHYRIGVNIGEMLAGNIGSEHHMQYTVVGDTVNLASRLCNVASTDQIIITEEAYKLPDIHRKIIASRHESIRIRGKSEPVTTYMVHDVQFEYQAAMTREIDAFLHNHSRKDS
jgi:adenylate cyclase